ncbi:hypothetical protein DL96DRAFT_1566071 [Flagelloscypha sp. PMI_526]|nr:hypothetical protein DL96DRAFT_1566071 [Flagelloscypha sp. PMI_526]
MSSISLDVLTHIFRALNTSTAETCCLVNSTFYQLAQVRLFNSLVLDAETWRAKCRFLLSEKGQEYGRRIRSLTLKLHRMPVFLPQKSVSADLLSTLAMIGSGVRMLSIDGYSDFRATVWNDISSTIIDALLATVFPHIHSIELNKIVTVPILTLASSGPNLECIYLRARYGGVTSSSDSIPTADVAFSRAVSFSLGGFTDDDFDSDTDLSKYLELYGESITCFGLFGHYMRDFPLNLGILAQLDTLKASLQHLSLGPELYQALGDLYSVQRLESAPIDLLPLPTFPRLHTLSLSMWLPTIQEEWPFWFQWVAQNLTQPSVTIEVVRLVVDSKVYYGALPSNVPSTRLDEILESIGCHIHCIVDDKGREEDIRMAVALIRECLPSWDLNARLKFWLRKTDT